ncbi:hypothetical protein EYF80_018715 [Liparis tanakae]|uniref:Uncharacterized protein n=1 Tax=Liparis tanakae TaxID=230148 RepID=A0A4Z2I197_9TELE|nr:hypothetical protein EYF80_018715 [Liparis tanakae]
MASSRPVVVWTRIFLTRLKPRLKPTPGSHYSQRSVSPSSPVRHSGVEFELLAAISSGSPSIGKLKPPVLLLPFLFAHFLWRLQGGWETKAGQIYRLGAGDGATGAYLNR